MFQLINERRIKGGISVQALVKESTTGMIWECAEMEAARKLGEYVASD